MPSKTKQPQEISGNDKSSRARLLVGVCVAAIAVASVSMYATSQEENGPGQVAYQKGMSAMAAGNTASAQAYFADGVRTDPDFGPNYVQLGVIYSSQRDFTQAADAYEHAAKLLPSDGKIWFVLSSVDVNLHDWTAAEAAGTKASKLLPKDADVWGQLASIENKLRHSDLAFDAYRQAHDLQPSNPEYLITLARFGVVTPQSTDELTYLERELATYLNSNPTDADAAKVMIAIEERLPPTPERLKSAISWGIVARDRYPKDADVSAALGQVYLSANRPIDALDAYRMANALRPNSTPLMHALEVCYVKTGQPEKASALARRIQAAQTHH